MEIAIQGLLFLGIIPALILLYFGLKGYDELYKEKTVFLTFVLGIVFGVISAVVRWYSSPAVFLIIYIVLFAFFEQLIKTIVLNLKRLQAKKETVIYGLSLGLGFGSSFTLFLVILGYEKSSDLSFVSLLTVGSLGFILFNAATSAYIGYGIYVKKLMKYLLIAILLQIPFNLIFDGTRYYNSAYNTEYYNSMYHIATQALLIAYGAIIFWYVITKIMPNILKDEKRKRTKKTKA